MSVCFSQIICISAQLECFILCSHKETCVDKKHIWLFSFFGPCDIQHIQYEGLWLKELPEVKRPFRLMFTGFRKRLALFPCGIRGHVVLAFADKLFSAVHCETIMMAVEGRRDALGSIKVNYYFIFLLLLCIRVTFINELSMPINSNSIYIPAPSVKLRECNLKIYF